MTSSCQDQHQGQHQDQHQQQHQHQHQHQHPQHTCRAIVALIRPNHLATFTAELRLCQSPPEGGPGGASFLKLYSLEEQRLNLQPLGCIALNGLQVEPLGSQKLRLLQPDRQCGQLDGCVIVTFSGESDQKLWCGLLTPPPPPGDAAAAAAAGDSDDGEEPQRGKEAGR